MGWIFGPPRMEKSGSQLIVNKLTKNPDIRKATNAKSNPLLVASEIQNDYDYPHAISKDRRRRTSSPSRDAGCCATIMILALPLLAMVFTIAFFGVVLDFDRSEMQMIGIYGDESLCELAEIYYGTARTDSFSFILSQYEPYSEVLALSSIACILVSMTTVARNVQIEVYHKRTESIIFMKFINYLAAIVNILSYMGLIMAVAFKVNQEEPSYAPQAHFAGALIFFAGTSIYSLLHSFLLWNQSEYPTFVRVLFLIFTSIIVTCSLLYGVPIWKGGMSSEEGSKPVYAWVAFFTSAISYGFYTVLFFVDSVDYEVSFFFCGGDERRRRR